MYPYDTVPTVPQLQEQISKMLSPNTQQQASIHTIRVNGRAGADAFSMPPNSDTILLDMNEPIIYFVMSDGAGYKTITPYDISIHKEVTEKDTLKSIEARLTKLEEAVKNNGKSNYKPNESKQHNDAGNRGNAQG